MTTISTRLVALLSFLALTGCDLTSRSAGYPPTGRSAERESSETLDTSPADDHGALFYQEPSAIACDTNERISIPFDFRHDDPDSIALVMPPQVVTCWDSGIVDDSDSAVDQRTCRPTVDYEIVYYQPIEYTYGEVGITCEEKGYVMVYWAVVPKRCSG